MTDLFENAHIICSCTWDDAVNDGHFIEITEAAKECGYTLPTAVTTNAWCRIIDFDQVDDDLIATRLTRLMLAVRQELIGKGVDDYPICFNYMGHDMMASVEGRNMQNREPVLTILLAEDR